MRPGIGQRGIGSTFFDHNQPAMAVFVHEMRFHREGLAIERIFARRIKMELQQVILLALNRYQAAGRIVQSDGVVILDSAERHFLAGKTIAGRPGYKASGGRCDVNRRLYPPQLAGRYIRR